MPKTWYNFCTLLYNFPETKCIFPNSNVLNSCAVFFLSPSESGLGFMKHLLFTFYLNLIGNP